MSDIPRNTPQERAGAKEKRPKMRTWRHENWKTSTSEHFTWRRKKVSQFRAVVSDCGGGRAKMANEQTGREGEGGGETGAVVFVDCYFKTSQPRDLEVKWNCQKKNLLSVWVNCSGRRRLVIITTENETCCISALEDFFSFVGTSELLFLHNCTTVLHTDGPAALDRPLNGLLRTDNQP